MFWSTYLTINDLDLGLLQRKEGMLNDEMVVKKPIVSQEFIVQKFTSTNQLDKVKTYKDFKISNGWLQKIEVLHAISRYDYIENFLYNFIMHHSLYID